MSRVVELLCSRRVPSVAVLALVSIGFAGCSADTSTRFGQNPFASQPDATASVQAPERPQNSRPQPQYQSQSLPPAIAAPQSYPPSGVSGGGRGVASYAPPNRPIETTGTVPRSIAARNPAQGSSQGTTIIVGTSDTLEVLARRYNVTPAAILQANGYKGPRALSPGQQLIIPHSSAVVAAPAQAAPATRPVMAAAAPASVHVVNRGDTLLGISRRYHVSVAELARANGIDKTARLRLGTKITVPASAAAVAPTTQPAVAVVQPAVLVPPATKMASLAGDPQQKARLAQSAPIEEAPVETPVKAAEATGALPTFRWPVRGKVITSYGAKTNGKANDGINLAVPEGTPVKAAEDGVVAYSGNELKGYGNLILIRHANGYVTAYAHASELLVKRGETIKRGQVIAKSGQSGDVGSPQLHFEIRKGSSPVDPLQFLNGA
ncbi:MAG: peptidoglycan DD-metalloendopeptidase family protein [Bradyrhizobium sp.]|jgi:murein DD-endopeptidase MepM/ murein hydrolase activator NlpD